MYRFLHLCFFLLSGSRIAVAEAGAPFSECRRNAFSPDLTPGDPRAPIAHHRFHVLLCLLQFSDALLKRVEFLLKHSEHALAWSSAMVPDAKDLGKLGQCESELQGMTHGLNALEAFRWIQAIS